MALPVYGDDIELTVVGVDKDRNTQFAVKWACDNLINHTSILILIHVRIRNHSGGPGQVSSKSDHESKQIFIPYQGFCARKGIQHREIILDGVSVADVLAGYVKKYCINNLVVGSSTRNILLRKFRNVLDVPTCLIKSVPDFCTFYVITKDKAVITRAAEQPLPSRLLQASSYSDDSIHSISSYCRESCRTEAWEMSSKAYMSPPPLETFMRMPPQEDYTKTPPREEYRKTPPQEDYMRPPRDGSSSSASDFSGSFGFQSHGVLTDTSTSSLSPTNSPYYSQITSSNSQGSSVEAEMKKLKLQLKQTMDMYSAACQEAMTAKQKAVEFEQLKIDIDEARKSDQARVAEKASRAILKMEKAKFKAAKESAQAAQRLAALEAKTKRGSEIKAQSEAWEITKVLNALSDVSYRKYAIEEIKDATEDFSSSLKIGEGGYGPVYRANLDHTLVAIKILRDDAAQGMKQFQQEVEVLSCIRHPNMVLLLGACPEYGCLVYEYMDNGSLEDRLFRKGGSPSIPWWTRFKIAAEIATGLLFLHQTKPEPLVHRDLKPANILLDRNYNSKISDVGLARLVPPSVANSVTQYHVTSAAGTFCYIDPEYQQTGLLGTKSDIYSLGIMFLQIVTAKAPMGLSHHVQKSIKRGTFADLLDPTVPDWPLDEAISFAKMALRCAELRKKDRPDLSTEILPELNRLRYLGYSYSSSNNSFSSSGANSYS